MVTHYSTFRIGPRSEVGQGQCQEKYRAEEGGRTTKGNGGRRTKRSFFSFLVIHLWIRLRFEVLKVIKMLSFDNFWSLSIMRKGCPSANSRTPNPEPEDVRTPNSEYRIVSILNFIKNIFSVQFNSVQIDLFSLTFSNTWSIHYKWDRRKQHKLKLSEYAIAYHCQISVFVVFMSDFEHHISTIFSKQ